MRASAMLCLALVAGCASDEIVPRSVVIEPMITIRGVGDSVDLGATPAPAFSGDGRFLVTTRLETPSNLVALLDSAGRYLKTIGRPGRGPGEIGRLTGFGFGPGDSLWVTDLMIQAHLFTPPPEARYVRTVRFDRIASADVTVDGFIAAPMYSVGADRKPRLDGVRLLSFNGAEAATYGPSLEGEDPESRMGATFLVDRSQAWAAWGSEYTIDLLGADGSVRRHLRREVDWFPADTTTPAPGDRPRPRISALAADEAGHLWVLLRRAHRDWEANRPKGPVMRGPVSPQRPGAGPPVDKVFEGVIEVLDATTGALIASREVGGGVLGFVKPGVIYERKDDSTGLVTLMLSRVSLDMARMP